LNSQILALAGQGDIPALLARGLQLTLQGVTDDLPWELQLPARSPGQGHGLKAEVHGAILQLSVFGKRHGGITAESPTDERLVVLLKERITGHIEVGKAPFHVPQRGALKGRITHLALEAPTIQSSLKMRLQVA